MREGQVVFVIVFEELLAGLVTACKHESKLFVVPLVHGDAAHERKVHTESAVLPGTVDAEKHPQIHGSPIHR